MRIIKNNQSAIKIAFCGITTTKLYSLKDILYFTADENYSVLHTSNEEFQTCKTLKCISEDLEDYDFVRCHRSILVNVHHISEIKTNKRKIVLHTSQKELPISDSGYRLLKEIISN